MLAQQFDGAHDHVIEVERVVVLEQGLVAGVRPRHHLAEVIVHGGGEDGRGDEFALRARDSREDGARGELARIDAQLREDGAHQLLLVGGVEDGERALDADRSTIDAENARADGVERAESERLGGIAEEADNPIAQFPRGFVGERDGDDAIRVNVLLGDEVGDPVSDDARLAAAGPGQDEERSLDVLDGF